MKTEAIVIGEDRVARLQSLELPEMAATRVCVESLYSGVSCGTEADTTSGRASFMTLPFVTGYQTVGKVIETGKQVRDIRAGDLVFTTGGALWPLAKLDGGGHARHLVVEEGGVAKLSTRNPSLRSAAYAALGGIALEGICRMNIAPGNTLAVFGLGMLGQLAGKLAQLMGLRVIGVNRSAWKRDAAKALGFDAVCAPIQSDIEAAGDVPKYAADTTGAQEIFELAVATLGRFGELSLLGYNPDPFPVNFDHCHRKQLTIHNPVGYGDQTSRVLEWIENGELNVESLIRHTVSPSEVTDFYRDLVHNHSRYLGVVIDWNAR